MTTVTLTDTERRVLRQFMPDAPLHTTSLTDDEHAALQRLVEHGLVTHPGHRYWLTDQGHELLKADPRWLWRLVPEDLPF